MDTWVRPIRRGWVVRGEVPGPDVDEFAEPDAVTAALASPAGAGDTLLAAQHPARTPAALAAGLDPVAAVPQARAMLARLRAEHYRALSGFVAAYRIDGGAVSGLQCLVDIRGLNAGIAHVRHTEEVYPEVVAERAAVLAGLGCATSAALLVPVNDGVALTEAVDAAAAGRPDVCTVDHAGRVHEVWVVPSGPVQEHLLQAASAADLLVADGNHRVAAAEATGSLLALITAGPRLAIEPIHRVLTGTGFTADQLAKAWQEAGLTVTSSADRTPPRVPGTAVVLAGETVLHVRLPDGGPLVIDHEVVERVLFAQALGLPVDGPHLRPLMAGRPVPEEADAVVQLAPVPFETVRAVHAAGRRMPRKATYFTPKPRGGLVLADL
ncbi:uncharacterized protein (DUF1015 family) [Amycolatopsis sulphurea]|uniref:Uncharacterized protein (DUF1015 family) n=1 Tax=Amycolatopsis sulphurea TaxID=76022 RepID=A0A2A9G0T4_9PSEU|nr:DUF1015 family protein [Amycolatopsis sulphurea]PFG56773.1 uncharacterized protein (DUF1015 family) [Amycolatopsis sulphurea]